MQHDDDKPAATVAREIIRGALKASLATLDAGSGFPYASLVTVATEPDGAPVLLLSDLAVHTRNLKADSRASLLFDASNGAGDPLAGGRVTVIGRMQKADAGALEPAQGRFLARQPSAQLYAGFADFAFWRMRFEGAHYIGGFGRIVDLPAAKLLTDLRGAEALVAAEAEIVEHMNDDHSDAVQLFATRLLGAPAGEWRISGIDPSGLDLVDGERGLRLSFASRVTSPAMAREALVALTKKARQTGLN